MEATADALEAAGVSPNLAFNPRAIGPTEFREVRVSVGWGRFTLLSLEDVAIPLGDATPLLGLESDAREIARRWGVTWRGDVQDGRIRVAFGAETPLPRARSEVNEAGDRLHDALVRVHAAHAAFRRRAQRVAWSAAPFLPTPAATTAA